MSDRTPSSNSFLTVLIVDGDSEFAEMAAAHLEQFDDRFTVLTEQRADAALGHLESETIDCVISRHQLPDSNGLEFLEAVRSEYPSLPFILLTDTDADEVGLEALDRGVDVYLQKEEHAEQLPVLAQQVVILVEKYRADHFLAGDERDIGFLEDNLEMIKSLYECQSRETHSREETVSMTVIRKVAERENVDPADLRSPLYESINPEALDALITPKTGETNQSIQHVTFTFHGYRITVYGDGQVRIQE